jgi:hemerythrin superfamily protein
MDIYNYLKKDHRKVSELMEKVLASRSADRREELFEEIKKELTLHAHTEEKTFYAALEESQKTEEKIEHAEEEHEEIEEYLEKLSKLSPESEKWLVTFGEFKHAVEHHVEEEEGEIFEKAQKVLSEKQAQSLAKEMDSLKKEEMKNLAA